MLCLVDMARGESTYTARVMFPLIHIAMLHIIISLFASSYKHVYASLFLPCSPVALLPHFSDSSFLFPCFCQISSCSPPVKPRKINRKNTRYTLLQPDCTHHQQAVIEGTTRWCLLGIVYSRQTRA